MPGISQIDPVWEWHWSFSRVSLARLFGEVFGADVVEIESHGNVLAAISLLHGVAAEELPDAKLWIRDAMYPVTLTVRAIKAGSVALP
ncbi:MAG: hypothetical protein WBA40_02925 [Roseiarcus sp.]|uniref:hypothetical protein n=1 Tax=Roseiarcus sp. TaxID=1969460 RepID=UPI003C49CD20